MTMNLLFVMIENKDTFIAGHATSTFQDDGQNLMTCCMVTKQIDIANNKVDKGTIVKTPIGRQNEQVLNTL